MAQLPGLTQPVCGDRSQRTDRDQSGNDAQTYPPARFHDFRIADHPARGGNLGRFVNLYP
jgi:hypothetical protein